LPKFNLLLEYDGEFWHRLPNQIENDRLKNLIASKCGYKLVRINGYKNLNNKWDIQEGI
jgi:very-short-patch-repair endonuclease